MKNSILFAAIILAAAAPVDKAAVPTGKKYTNSIGLQFVHIPRKGSPQSRFTMGFGQKPLPDGLIIPEGQLSKKTTFPNGDFDEHPTHQVEITKPFYLGMYEVTNAQYEQFDPTHRNLRGKLGFSKADDWFYEGRVTSDERRFHPRTTDKIDDPKWVNRKEKILPSLTVGQTPPNPWGLYDMHGNVEEWCYDWYGPYVPGPQTDPVGRAEGNFRVTRGGSHSTELYYLRSSNRMGTLPEDRNWYIGFRVVLGPMPDTKPRPRMPPPQYQKNVEQKIPPHLACRPDRNVPYFRGPRRYVNIPPDSKGPLFSNHNHDPAIVECPNGDLLTIWYTCVEEDGRELAVAASRLRYGAREWEPASPFWDAPDRNDHCPGLWFDGRDTIYHFNGLSAAATWGNLAIILRTSRDNGVTWSRARLIVPEHGYRQMVGEPVFRTQEGAIVFGADAIYGSTIWVSRDNGLTWSDPGGTLNGIHAGIVQFKDDRLMALGRGMNVDGMMPKSISRDMGKTWQPGPSPFPPISSGQRLALMRLKQGHLFLASFADKLVITDAAGQKRTVSGLFGAISFDDGRTWPVRRLITDDGPGKKLNGGAWTGEFTMSQSTAEPKGYLSVCQTPDAIINLISSALHYQFNVAWLRTPMPALNR